jgi:hypothetical protein
MCGSRRIERKDVTVRLPDGRQAGPVQAEVCSACGERYYDLAAMQKLELARRRHRSKRQPG